MARTPLVCVPHFSKNIVNYYGLCAARPSEMGWPESLCYYSATDIPQAQRVFLMRIVTLTPSATELVCQLGLKDQLVGVSHECDFPESIRGLPRLTRSQIPLAASSGEIDELVRDRVSANQSLYALDIPLLERLKPDLLVTQSLCDVCAVAESDVAVAVHRLAERPKVVNLAPTRLADLYENLQSVADAAQVSQSAREPIESLKRRVAAVSNRSEQVAQRPRVLFLEWIDPLFCAGHWSPELVHLAGGVEGIGRAGQRSRTIAWEEVVTFDPDVLVIACCGFDTNRNLEELLILRRHPGFADLRCVRSGRVYIADGNAYFNRPGPRLVDSLEILAHALHPELRPLADRLEPAYRPSQSELKGD